MSTELMAHARELGVTLSGEQVQQLLQYAERVIAWNRVFNLTGAAHPEDFVREHIVDSLSLAPHLEGDCVLDVGAGAGLPGIVLAIARPEVQWVLLDSRQKRTRFLKQMRQELPLTNVTVLTQRVESYTPERAFPCIISRAFAPLPTYLALVAPLLASGGVCLHMASQWSDAPALPPGFEVEAVHPIVLPGLDKARHIVAIRHK